MAEETAVVAAPAAKVAKKKAAKAKTSGPTVSQRIVAIVTDSKDRNGVSRPAIRKQLADGGYDVEGNKSRICTAIRSLLASEVLTPVKGSFKLNKNHAAAAKPKKVGATKPVAKKPAAKKPAAKKPAEKKSAAKKKVAKKPAAKAVKKPAAKKVAAKKPAAKAAKKPAAGTPKKKAVKSTKKSPAKKVTAKKAPKPKSAKKAAPKKK